MTSPVLLRDFLDDRTPHRLGPYTDPYSDPSTTEIRALSVSSNWPRFSEGNSAALPHGAICSQVAGLTLVRHSTTNTKDSQDKILRRCKFLHVKCVWHARSLPRVVHIFPVPTSIWSGVPHSRRHSMFGAAWEQTHLLPRINR